MARTVSVTEFRRSLSGLKTKRRRGQPRAVALTHRGEKIYAIMPWEDYEAMQETMDILSDRRAMEAIRQSEKDIKAGRTYSSAQVKRALKL